MAPHTTRVAIRASQLGLLRLQFCQIQPELLNGLLTVAESQRLKILQGHPSPIFFFKADDLNGRRFARLVEQPGGERLRVRCALLQLWAEGIAGLLGEPAPAATGEKPLRDRFRRLVEQMPEAEWLNCSSAELARQLHCSARHFCQLFHRRFGMSFRQHQIELRLQRACRLLADPTGKISDIASGSGYRHLGLFHAQFKKRFGMTPAEWGRRKASSS
ncbi:MAG: helix-turn-helix transcriptional regulator [Verrucomicrobiota bacterium]|nr:helix-turn-helix transcriptional regulator [Verrucomicrobiota bacterium]